MMVHQARIIALAVVLIDISGLALNTHLHAQQPLDGLRAQAEQGDAEAQSTLGVMYRDGRSVPQDYAEAIRWFRAAANHGDAAAQFNLGVMYKNGDGVPQDYVEAHMWLNLAAAQSSGENRDTTWWPEMPLQSASPTNSPKPNAVRGSGRRRPSRDATAARGEERAHVNSPSCPDSSCLDRT